MKVYLAGDFTEKQLTVAALRELKANGFGPEDLDVFSDEPLKFPRSVLNRRTHMSAGVVIGAITFCLLGTGFVYFTQYNYPLITGGMPLFSFWATGVLFYELTMFGAIVTAFSWFLWESGLLKRGARAPIPAIEPGIICLRVRCHSTQEEETSRLLSLAGASRIRKVGEAI